MGESEEDIILNKKNISQLELDKALKRNNELEIMKQQKKSKNSRKRRKQKLPKTPEETSENIEREIDHIEKLHNFGIFRNPNRVNIPTLKKESIAHLRSRPPNNINGSRYIMNRTRRMRASPIKSVSISASQKKNQISLQKSIPPSIKPGSKSASVTKNVAVAPQMSEQEILKKSKEIARNNLKKNLNKLRGTRGSMGRPSYKPKFKSTSRA